MDKAVGGTDGLSRVLRDCYERSISSEEINLLNNFLIKIIPLHE